MSDIAHNHGLFLYDSDDEFLDRIASFLGPGTEEGETGIAVLSKNQWKLLREALGDVSRRIRYLDNDAVYTRPERTLARYDAIVRRIAEEGKSPIRLIGEIPASKTQEHCETWELYEAVVTRVFADRPVSLVCAYDLRQQPAAAVEAAWHTHPWVLADGWEDNPRYREPGDVVRTLTPPPAVLTDLHELPIDADASAFRSGLRKELATLEVPKAQADKLLLAATEVFDNANAHGRGARSQRIGPVAGLIVWELSDNGAGFDDPLAGYIPPTRADARGLWRVRQLSQRVEFFASERGFTTRLWI